MRAGSAKLGGDSRLYPTFWEPADETWPPSMRPTGNLIRWGDQCARVGPWRADSSVAYLVPAPNGRPPSAEFVRRCVRLLAAQGFRRVVTGALTPSEQAGFLEAGFDVHERLHLLTLGRAVPLPPLPRQPRLHRAAWYHRRAVLDLDASAFSPFWQLDKAGLRDALAATAHHRFSVVLEGWGNVVGYAVCGASGSRGFVQRLAVAPRSQGRGLGRKLLLDGLYWLRSVGAHDIAVNTQMGNEAALALYKRVGFQEEAVGLSVLVAATEPVLAG